MFRGFYTIHLEGYDTDGNLILCSDVTQMVQFGTSNMRFHDYLNAIVAFAVAGASSYYLAQLFPFVSRGMLPLITGYLGIGIVVGPFVTSLISDYDIYLLSQYINEFALAFIAANAGCEIYFPELRGLVRPILMQIFFMTVTTFAIVSAGTYFLAPLVPFLADQPSSDCRSSIVLLLSSIMLARSPATAVAIISELRARGPGSKVMLGITVISDIVVLISYDIMSGVTQVTCADDAATKHFNVQNLYFLLFEIGASMFIGVLVGGLIRFYLWLPFRRFIIPCGTSCRIYVYRSHLKALFILPTLLSAFELSRYVSVLTRKYSPYHTSVKLEPLMLCIVAGCVAGHSSRQRRKFTNILRRVAPAVFLPFFVLTGASLQLGEVHRIAFIASVVCGLRLVGIFLGSTLSGLLQRACSMGTTVAHVKYMWMTLLAQAGVALGLAISTKQQFPEWGQKFETLVISVVVINQVVGPVLCKIGLYQIEIRDLMDKVRGPEGSHESGHESGGNARERERAHGTPAASDVGNLSDVDDLLPASHDDHRQFLTAAKRWHRSHTMEEHLAHNESHAATESHDVQEAGPLARNYARLLRKHSYGTLATLAEQLEGSDGAEVGGRAQQAGDSEADEVGEAPLRRSGSGLFFRPAADSVHSDMDSIM